jgi:hypothetical protein
MKNVNLLPLLNIFLISSIIFLSGCGHKPDSNTKKTIINKTINTKYLSQKTDEYWSEPAITVDYDSTSRMINLSFIMEYKIDSCIVERDSVNKRTIFHKDEDARVATVISSIYTLGLYLIYDAITWSDKNEYYNKDSIIRKWSTTIKVDRFINTDLTISQNGDVILNLETNNEGVTRFNQNKIITKEFTSYKIGTVNIRNYQIPLCAPYNLCMSLLKQPLQKRDLEYLTYIYSRKEMPANVLTQISETIRYKVLSDMNYYISNGNYYSAISTLQNFLYLGIDSDRIIDAARKIPMKLISDYNLAKLIYDPALALPSIIGEPVLLEGTIIQVIPDVGFLFSPSYNSKYDIIYCTVSNYKLLNSLLDNAHIKIIGYYKGPKSYTSIIGSTKTVPSIEVCAIK